MSKPILSIIIPTKNGVDTIDYAIRSCLEIKDTRNEVEVIIQDCSTDNETQSLVEKKYKNTNVKYFKSEGAPSMNENWEYAIINSTGKFICGIGDDDAVLPNILDLARWAYNNEITTIYQPMVNYIWKGAYLGTYSSGKIAFSEKTSKLSFMGAEEVLQCRKMVIKKCGFEYNSKLPNIYHGIVRADLIEMVFNKTGHRLGGTSLDVYSAITLAELTEKHAITPCAFSIRGASFKSNTNRIVLKKENEHYSELKEYKKNPLLPSKLMSADISVTETCIDALNEIARPEIIYTMDFSFLYGRCIALNLKLALPLFNEYKVKVGGDFYNILKMSIKYYKMHAKSKLTETLFYYFQIISPSVASWLYRKLSNGVIKIEASDILIAAKYYCNSNVYLKNKISSYEFF